MRLIVLLIVLLAPMLASAQSPEMVARFKGGEPKLDAESVTIPFAVEATHILLVESMWNGNPMPVLVDTGGMTMIDSLQVEELGIQPQAMGPNFVANVDDIAMGDAHVEGLKVGVLDFRGTFNKSKANMLGMIGSDWLRFFQTTIDYQRSEITLSKPVGLTAEGEGDHLMDMEIVLPYLPTVPVKVGDLELKGMIDTGLHFSFVLPWDYFAKLSADLQKSAVEADGWFARWPFPGPQRSMMVRFDEIQVGDIVLHDQVALFADTPSFIPEDAILLGKFFLDDYITMLDYEHKQVLLRETEPIHDTIRETFGFNITTEDNVTSICGVWWGSPAEQAGVQLNEIILEVDGVPIDDVDKNELRRRLCDPTVREIVLGLSRAGGVRDVRVEKVKML